MRILLSLHHALNADQGAPGLTMALGRAYERLGHEVSYFSFAQLPARLPPLGRELLFPEFFAWHVRRREKAVDVIDASTGDAWLWARLRGPQPERPLLVTRSHGLEHRYWEQEVREAATRGARLPGRTRAYHGGLRLAEVGASLRHADVCVFSNREDLGYAVDGLGVDRERAVVRLNGLEAQMLGRSLAPAPSGEVGIAHIGSYAQRKGAAYLTSALVRVLGRRDDVRVSLLGTRVPRDRVLAAIPSSLHARVEVIPEYSHADLPRLLERHQILVSASLAEGFSLALPEGMACGLAPVATAIPGALEIVEDGVNGLLVPPADSESLAAALEGLLTDQTRLEALRRNALDSVQDLSWDRIASNTVELYEDFMPRAHGALVPS